MATTPDWLAFLQQNPQYMRTNYDTLLIGPDGRPVGPGYQGNDATAFNAMYSHGGYQGENNEGPSTLTGYRGYQFIPGHGANAEGKPAKYNGQAYTDYDAQGNKTGTGAFEGLGDGMAWKQGLGMIAASALGGHLLSGMGGAPGGPDFSMGFTDGGTAGGALDTAYAGGGGMGAGGGLTTVSHGVAPLAPEVAASIPGPLSTIGAGSALGGAGSLLGQAGSLLGPAAAVLGAAAGAQGQENTTTNSRDPWAPMQPYILGLLNDSNTLRQQQQPLANEAGALLMNQGRGLLNQPIAGNGFQQFAQRRI